MKRVALLLLSLLVFTVCRSEDPATDQVVPELASVTHVTRPSGLDADNLGVYCAMLYCTAKGLIGEQNERFPALAASFSNPLKLNNGIRYEEGC